MNMDFILIGLISVAIAILIALLLRKPPQDFNHFKTQFDTDEKNQELIERSVRYEVAKNREELRQSLDGFGKSVFSNMTGISNLQKNQLDTFSNQLSTLTRVNDEKLEKVRSVVEERLKLLQQDN